MSAPKFSSNEEPQRKKKHNRLAMSIDIVHEHEVDFNLFGCFWSVFTLPFRLVWRVIRLIGSFFDD